MQEGHGVLYLGSKSPFTIQVDDEATGAIWQPAYPNRRTVCISRRTNVSATTRRISIMGVDDLIPNETAKVVDGTLPWHETEQLDPDLWLG